MPTSGPADGPMHSLNVFAAIGSATRWRHAMYIDSFPNRYELQCCGCSRVEAKSEHSADRPSVCRLLQRCICHRLSCPRLQLRHCQELVQSFTRSTRIANLSTFPPLMYGTIFPSQWTVEGTGGKLALISNFHWGGSCDSGHNIWP